MTKYALFKKETALVQSLKFHLTATKEGPTTLRNKLRPCGCRLPIQLSDLNPKFHVVYSYSVKVTDFHHQYESMQGSDMWGMCSVV